MKVSTITCHDVYNHGASLQAYALQQYLTNIGLDSQIINYKPPYLSNQYKMLSINNPKWKKNLVTKTFYLVCHFPFRIISLRRKKNFDKFTSKNLKISEKKFTSIQELKTDCPDADFYICGSDQIWNCLHNNGKDPSFYLEFAPENKVKFSYAASFATEVIPEKYREFVETNVKKLDGVSVRESSGVDLLKALGISAVNVVDPVFLLNKQEWFKFSKKKPKEKYILIYDFDNSNLIKEIALDIKKKTGLKIYIINQSKQRYYDKSYALVGPDSFVNLIKNAEVVISNSYHAAVFSIIFEIDFYIVNRSESINTRMRDLLYDLKLESRLIREENLNREQLLNKIDYDETRVILNKKITLSKKFLRENLVLKKE
ncbi:polysaccharide pyruvyl transferase family protein [Sutcliffiella horikoshii]|uniref:polysaccharide pyruvyl transferase family protein n=1 Tax=Sutcliffiella horikoshii TaxID=79883 RepID=UPI001CBB970E|nr:polysaccharide pyruvyl transferase family protein [Sutcliffiella horikoshii]UAL46934.1 polysaccharide pyruvyl transferase family protein [Sutcliffiella horikoshii]